MSRLDHILYAFTRYNSGGPVVQYVDDELAPIEPSADTKGIPTRAGLIGYVIAYAVASAAVAYFLFI